MAKFSAGFIGSGNMGGALAIAVCKKIDPAGVVLTDYDFEKAKAVAGICGCVAADTETVAKESEYLFLGVKPQVLDGVLRQLAPMLAVRKDRVVLVSMAAGVSIAHIQEVLGDNYPIIRIMPNMPVTVGKGMILYATNADVTEQEKQQFTAMMGGAGSLDQLEEKLIDAGSAVSGCGPAFAYLFVEALADGGVECGLPRGKALQYAAQTLLGAAEMVLATGKHPGELKDAVCSPGGTTIAGVHALEEGGFRSAAMDAVCVAYRRTKELSK